MATPGIFYVKNAIHKEMPNREPADTNQVGGNFHRQPATFDNTELLRWSTKKRICDAQECPKVAFLGTRLGTQSL